MLQGPEAVLVCVASGGELELPSADVTADLALLAGLHLTAGAIGGHGTHVWPGRATRFVRHENRGYGRPG
jgi:hypothetical protein